MSKAKTKKPTKKVKAKKVEVRVSETNDVNASVALQTVLKAVGDLSKKDAVRVLNSADKFIRGRDDMKCDCDCECDCGY